MPLSKGSGGAIGRPAGSRRLWLAGAVVAGAMLLLVRGPWLAQAGWRNAGYLALDRQLMAAEPDLAPAQRWFDRAEAIAADPGIAFATSLVHTARHEMDAAQAVWRTLPNSDLWALAWSNKRLNEGNLPDALEWAQQVIALNPDLADGWYNAGLVYEELRDLEQAAIHYQAALEQTERAQVGVSDIYAHLGIVAGRQEDWPGSAAWLAESLVRDTFSHDEVQTQAHFYYAEALLQLGRSTEARYEYTATLEAAPRHYGAHLGLAALAWQTGDPAGAEALYQAAIAIEPQDKAAYRGLADLYRATERIEAAIEAYTQVLQIDPNDRAAARALSELSP